MRKAIHAARCLPVGILCLHSIVALSQQTDSIKLPFAIATEKRLSDEDLANKKEDFYVTGAPDLSSDPINGFGYGAEGSIYFTGKRNDPFFAYTAYRTKIDFVVFNTTKDSGSSLSNLMCHTSLIQNGDYAWMSAMKQTPTCLLRCYGKIAAGTIILSQRRQL